MKDNKKSPTQTAPKVRGFKLQYAVLGVVEEQYPGAEFTMSLVISIIF